MKSKGKPRSLTRAAGMVCVAGVLASVTEARAATPAPDASGWGDVGAIPSDGSISEEASLQFACTQAAFWQQEATRAEAAAANKEVLCSLDDAAQRQALKKAADALVAACAPQAAQAEQIQEKLAREAAEALANAKVAYEDAKRRAAETNQAYEEWKEIVERLGNKATPDDRQRLGTKHLDAKAADERVKKAQEDVTAKEAAADKAEIAKKASAQAAEKALTTKKEAAAQMREALSRASLRANRSPSDFEARVDNPAWMKACEGLRKRQRDANILVDKESDATEAPKQARSEDILRKAPSIPSVIGGTNGFLETSGAPDRVTYSLFSALGADQKTNGTQVVMTLGLNQIWPTTTPLEDRPAWMRNLFVRATVPLTATQDVPVGGAPTTRSDGTSVRDVSRMSFVIGTSLADDSDPRVASNRPCYLSVLSYLPFAQTATEKDEAAQDERKDYFDICNRRAANRQRLALRAGIGLVIADDDAQKTRTEYLSAAAVWTPASWITFNGLYQHLYLPFERHHFGGGFSTAWNVSTSESGVDAWVRLGVDLLVLGTYDEATKKSDIETRITGALRFKLPQSSIITLGIGPRLVGSAIQEPGILASVGLTYDADQLLEPLMSGPATTKP